MPYFLGDGSMPNARASTRKNTKSSAIYPIPSTLFASKKIFLKNSFFLYESILGICKANFKHANFTILYFNMNNKVWWIIWKIMALLPVITGLEPVCCKKRQKIVTGLRNKVLNGTKLILDDHGNNLDSFRISLESFRSFKGPLPHKPVLVRNYFLPFLTANRL